MNVSDHVCDTEFASNMTFKVVTSILNFYIPTAFMVVLNVKIFLVILRRSKDIDRLGACAASSASTPMRANYSTGNNNAIQIILAAQMCAIWRSTNVTGPIRRRSAQNTAAHAPSPAVHSRK